MILVPSDPRCQTGALIQSASERLYRVFGLEERVYVNFGRLGGTLGGGLFVQMEGEVDHRCPKCRVDMPRDPGHVSWLSPESVLAAKLMIGSPPACPDVYDA
jgi:hypothetical protein